MTNLNLELELRLQLASKFQSFQNANAPCLESLIISFMLQALKERATVFDPIRVEERNRALRLKVQELQEEIVKLKEGKYEEAERLQHQTFQVTLTSLHKTTRKQSVLV